MTKKKLSHHKRIGKHHSHSHKYVKVYAPYLPLLIAVLISLVISAIQPVAGEVLPYSTEMSRGSLLSNTNSRRSANGIGGLSLNSKLNSAAQSKANHMVVNDYWAHVAPDGTQPWYFIGNAGYDYKKAGENLAYGFLTSSSTVTGWMNSPSHKANMLDGGYTDVGFGYANSANFVGDGNQTIVVAMYGTPQVASSTSNVQSSQPAPEPAPAPEPEPVPTPAPTEPKKEKKPKPKDKPVEEKEEEPIPVTTDISLAEADPEPQAVTRASLTGAPWILGSITVFLFGLLAFRLLHFSIKLKKFLKHHPKLRKAVRQGKLLVLHHPLLDSTILGLAILAFVLSRVSGIIL